MIAAKVVAADLIVRSFGKGHVTTPRTHLAAGIITVEYRSIVGIDSNILDADMFFAAKNCVAQSILDAAKLEMVSVPADSHR